MGLCSVYWQEQHVREIDFFLVCWDKKLHIPVCMRLLEDPARKVSHRMEVQNYNRPI